MTTRKEAKAKLDALSDSAFEEVVKVIEAQEHGHQAQADELERLLKVLAEPLPTAEQQELLRDLERRPWQMDHSTK